MTTVVPANSTAWPAVAIGGAGRVLDAHAVVQVLAVPGDDEQRVVDADAEADHRAEDQRELGDVHEGRQHADAGGADEDAHERRARSGAPSRRPSRTRRSSTMIATPMPISSLLGVSCASWASAPVSSTLHAAGAGGVGDRRGVVELRGGELVDRVGDVDVGGLPVGADGGGLRPRTGR